MSLKIEDIKPGDILLYDGDWYALIVQQSNYKKSYLWISGDSREERFIEEAYRLPELKAISLNDLLSRSIKVTHLSNKILIEELKKIK